MKPKKLETNKLTKSANAVAAIYKDLHININSIKPVGTTTVKDYVRTTNSVPSSNLATSKASSVVNKSKSFILIKVTSKSTNSSNELKNSIGKQQIQYRSTPINSNIVIDAPEPYNSKNHDQPISESYMYNSADTRDSKIVSAAIKKAEATLTLQNSNNNFNTIGSNETAEVGKSPKNILNATSSNKTNLNQGQTINSFRKIKTNVNAHISGNSNNNIVHTSITPIDMTKFNMSKIGQIAKKGSNGNESIAQDQVAQATTNAINSGNSITDMTSTTNKSAQTHKKNKSTDKIIKKVVANIIIGYDSMANSGSGFLGPNSNKSNNTPKGGLMLNPSTNTNNAVLSKKNSPKEAISISSQIKTDTKLGQLQNQLKINSIDSKSVVKKECTSPKDKASKDENPPAQTKIKNINLNNQNLELDINKYIQKATTFSKPKNNKMSFQGNIQNQPSTAKNNIKHIISNNIYSPKQSIILPSNEPNDIIEPSKKEVKSRYKHSSEVDIHFSPTNDQLMIEEESQGIKDFTPHHFLSKKMFSGFSIPSIISKEERDKITAELSADSHILNSIVNFKKLISNDAPLENLKTLFTQDETLLKINNLNYEIHKIESLALNNENDEEFDELKQSCITVINANSIGKFNSAPPKLKQLEPEAVSKVNTFQLMPPHTEASSKNHGEKMLIKRTSTLTAIISANREIVSLSMIRSKKYKLIFETINSNIMEAFEIISEFTSQVTNQRAVQQSIYNNYESNHQIIEIKSDKFAQDDESENAPPQKEEQVSDFNLLNVSKELAKIDNSKNKESFVGLSKLSSCYFKEENNNNSTLSGLGSKEDKAEDVIQSYNCKFRADIKQKQLESLSNNMKPQTKTVVKDSKHLFNDLEINETMNDLYLEKMNIISNTLVESMQNESLGISEIYLNNDALYGFIDESISVIENISNQLNSDYNIETDYYRILTKLPQGKSTAIKQTNMKFESVPESQLIGKKVTKRASEVSNNEMDVTIENSYLESKHSKKYSQILNNLEKLKHMVSYII